MLTCTLGGVHTRRGDQENEWGLLIQVNGGRRQLKIKDPLIIQHTRGLTPGNAGTRKQGNGKLKGPLNKGCLV